MQKLNHIENIGFYFFLCTYVVYLFLQFIVSGEFWTYDAFPFGMFLDECKHIRAIRHQLFSAFFDVV
ncbi:hypothetical protein CCAND93_660010 [Capnocytophaga canis]|uniref:Uncharacterized protein n=1 Tax=Capnocytophaga canis TaxID=1848903 RepID=A0A0B7IPZ2_9FLAO|nr:hypothetical protein CCAND93_660010 [Capnocytophaga canis]